MYNSLFWSISPQDAVTQGGFLVDIVDDDILDAMGDGGFASRGAMPKYPENLIHFSRSVLEHYELHVETPRMFVRSMSK